jgi:hypothetical protein
MVDVVTRGFVSLSDSILFVKEGLVAVGNPPPA